MRAVVAMLSLLAALSACAEGESLTAGRDEKTRTQQARRLNGLAPAPRGALPPPDQVFEAAQSADPAERAAARRLLEEARRTAGLPAGATVERVSFLDLPEDVAFAAPSSGASFAVLPITGAPAGVRDALNDALIDALGGRATRENAYLAQRRFVLDGSAAAGRGVDTASFVVEWRLADSGGAPIATVAEHHTASSRGDQAADPWRVFTTADLVAAARRGAERILAQPAVRTAVAAHAGFGGLDPATPRKSHLPAHVAGRWPAGEAPPMVVAGVRGAQTQAAEALEAAIGVALASAGATLAGSEAMASFSDLYEVSAEVSILRGPQGDKARILWRVSRSGRSLGVVRQENAGARGVFDGAWGPQAVAAAKAAAPGLVALVKADGA